MIALFFDDVSIAKDALLCEDMEDNIKCSMMIEIEMLYCLLLSREMKNHALLSTIQNNNNNILQTDYLNQSWI